MRNKIREKIKKKIRVIMKMRGKVKIKVKIRENESENKSKGIENIVYKCERGGVVRNDWDYFGKKDTPLPFLPLLFLQWII